MREYEFIDYSCIEEEPETFLDFTMVTCNNIARIRKAIPNDQRDHVKENDEVAVYFIRNSAGETNRKLTVWYNREIAAIETSGGSIWGDWDEDEELLLTEEFETAQDCEGSMLIGRISYNKYGIRGIYASGRFYAPVDDSSSEEL